MPQLDPEILGKLLDIVYGDKRTDSVGSTKANTGIKTNAEVLKQLARKKRSLRISANGYTSTGGKIPASLQNQIDDVNARIAELK